MGEYSHNPLISADSANQGNHLNGLTTRQDRALMALLESPSIAAAARKAEVGESTLRQWLREDEDAGRPAPPSSPGDHTRFPTANALHVRPHGL